MGSPHLAFLQPCTGAACSARVARFADQPQPQLAQQTTFPPVLKHPPTHRLPGCPPPPKQTTADESKNIWAPPITRCDLPVSRPADWDYRKNDTAQSTQVGRLIG